MTSRGPNVKGNWLRTPACRQQDSAEHPAKRLSPSKVGLGVSGRLAGGPRAWPHCPHLSRFQPMSSGLGQLLADIDFDQSPAMALNPILENTGLNPKNLCKRRSGRMAGQRNVNAHPPLQSPEPRDAAQVWSKRAQT